MNKNLTIRKDMDEIKGMKFRLKDGSWIVVLKAGFYCDKNRHLVCIPYSAENLHKMARELCLGSHWFHKGRLPHYDIPKLAMERISKQCTVVSSKVIVNIIKRKINPQLHEQNDEGRVS